MRRVTFLRHVMCAVKRKHNHECVYVAKVLGNWDKKQFVRVCTIRLNLFFLLTKKTLKTFRLKRREIFFFIYKIQLLLNQGNIKFLLFTGERSIKLN